MPEAGAIREIKQKEKLWVYTCVCVCAFLGLHIVFFSMLWQMGNDTKVLMDKIKEVKERTGTGEYSAQCNSGGFTKLC